MDLNFHSTTDYQPNKYLRFIFHHPREIGIMASFYLYFHGTNSYFYLQNRIFIFIPLVFLPFLFGFTVKKTLRKMRISGKIWTSLLFFSIFTAPSAAEIISQTFRYSRRHVFEFAEFNFTHTGYVSVAISSAWVGSDLSQPDYSRVGFFLLSDEVRSQHHPELYRTGGKCILDSELISVLFTFEDLSHYSFNKTYPVTHPGKNSLYFINCNEKSIVLMEVHAELYNIDCDGTTKIYLSAGLTQLPSLHFLFSFIYLCFLGFWIFICFKNKPSFHKIHLLMGVLLVITFAHFICAAMDRHNVKVTGTPHGWDVFFYMFQLIRGLLFFIVIVLIGAGWRSWKPLLKFPDKLALIDMIVFQVLGTLCSILVGEISHYSDDWLNWNLDVVLGDYSSCFIIFMPMHLSIISLRKDSETDGNAATNLAKLYLFLKVALGYVFLTRIVVDGIVFFGLAPGVVNMFPWVMDAVKETGTLVFTMVMFYIYMPLEENVGENNVGEEDEEIGLVSHRELQAL